MEPYIASTTAFGKEDMVNPESKTAATFPSGTPETMDLFQPVNGCPLMFNPSIATVQC